MNLRETLAWRAIAAMLSPRPVAASASTAAATRSRLSWLSSRRDATIACPWAVMPVGRGAGAAWGVRGG
jgi:hypothetical protein